MTPDQLASTSEHSHQRALFAWANCAALYGMEAADDNRNYSFADRASIPENVKLRYRPLTVLTRLFAIHNQGHGDAIRGGKAKAEGVKAGVPDVMLPVPVHENGGAWFCGLFIELKKPKLGRTSEKQSEWLDYLNDAGYRCYVCYGWREAVEAIKEYLAPIVGTE